MAKSTKATASQTALKLAYAKLIEKHKGLKLALIADTVAAAAVAESATQEVTALDDVTADEKPN